MQFLEIADQTAFNIERWEEALANPELATLEHRIETDEYGNTIMIPPPGLDHGMSQSDIASELKRLMGGGRTITECPISTSGGVKAADVAWISDERLLVARASNLLTRAPEICVEVLSPGNTRAELENKRALYFEAGADEVWFFDLEGTMHHFLSAGPEEEAPKSVLCPDFPTSW